MALIDGWRHVCRSSPNCIGTTATQTPPCVMLGGSSPSSPTRTRATCCSQSFSQTSGTFGECVRVIASSPNPSREDCGGARPPSSRGWSDGCDARWAKGPPRQPSVCPSLVATKNERRCSDRSSISAVYRLCSSRGAAGMGKTRLVEEILRDLRWRGHEVLFGTALVRYRQGIQPTCSGGIRCTHAGSEQAGRQSGRRPLHGGGSSGLGIGAVSQVRLHRRNCGAPMARSGVAESIARVLSALAIERPVVLAIDDVHLADSETLNTLERLPQLITTSPVALVLTFRREEARRRPEVWRGARGVGPEPPKQTPSRQATVATRHSGAARGCDAISEGTHGHVGARRKWRASARGHRSHPRPSPQARARPRPGSSGHSRLRIEDLDEDCDAVLRFAAVFDGGVAMQVLLDGLEMAEDRIVAAVEALQTARLLAPRASVYEFSHALVRDAVYTSLPPDERVRLHGIAFRVLREAGGEPGAIGAQAEAAGLRESGFAQFARAGKLSAERRSYAGRSRDVRQGSSTDRPRRRWCELEVLHGL